MDHATRYQNTGLHSRCARVNSHVPQGVPVCQPYAPAAPRARKNSGMTCTIQVIGAIVGSSPSRLPIRRPSVSGGEQQCAVPEHHNYQCGEPHDVDGAIASRRSVFGDPARIGHGLGERQTFRMAGCGPPRMSRTTQST